MNLLTATTRKHVLTFVLAGLCTVLAGFVFSATPAHSGTCAAGNVALQAGKAFVSAARSRSPARFASALNRYTNMHRISLFALGKYRSKLGKGNERQFVSLTSRYVARTLADFSAKFRANTVEILRCRGATVESQLTQLGGRPPQKVLWKISGGKVSDVNVQNVWLAQLLRSNFNSVLRKGGGNINVLLAHLGGGAGQGAKIDQK